MKSEYHKIYRSALFLILSSHVVFSQIGGISASKLNSVNHAPIPKGDAEFEPNVTYSYSSKTWNGTGDLQDRFQSPDSLQIDGAVSFRLAYTLSDQYEVGAIIADEYSSWSVKRELMTKGQMGLGMMAGLNLPFGTATINRSQRTGDQVATYGLGLIGSYQMSDDASIDVNLQYQGYFNDVESNADSDVFLSLDFGQYINDQNIYLIGSWLYQHSSITEGTQSKLTFSPCIALEMKRSYMITINANLDLIGKRTDKTSSFNVAWTITL